MFKQDFILRMIDELAQAVAAALRKADEQRFDEAKAALDGAEQKLGLMRDAERLDARSLAALLGGDRSVLYARLLLARASLSDRRGDRRLADRTRRRARELLQHSQPEQLGEQKARLTREAFDHELE